jgi:hypothetical protein
MSRLVLAVALALVALPAYADETEAPARMTSCEVLPATMDHRVTPPETIRVSFMITGDVAADLVRFTAVAPAGGFHEFTLHGNFTNTVMIDRRKVEADIPAPSESPVPALPHDVECALTSIHFVDGSSWSAARHGEPDEP